MTKDEQAIFDHVDDEIQINRKGRVLPPIDLDTLYNDLKEKFFGESVPDLSPNFVCVFQPLPRDATGVCLREQEVSQIRVKSAVDVPKGIRINEKLRDFLPETQIALLHEMIHASGVVKHEEAFKSEIMKLIEKGAYTEPLIL